MTVDVDYVLQHGDPRLATWPMMDSPVKTIAVIIFYLTFITVIGPRFMQNRKPYDLRKYMVIYNAFIVGTCAWMFIRFSLYGWFTTYSWKCESIDYSNNDMALKTLTTFYVFYMSKFAELLDTVFFTLRKKYSQVTFLHLFHHSIVPITFWYATKYGAGGYAIILPMANSFVHIWMYSYYLLSAMGPSLQKYLWWKKHLTKLQIIQFIVVTSSMTYILIVKPEYCNAREFIVWIHLSLSLIFFVLFTHFYIKSYRKSKCDEDSSIKNFAQKNDTHKPLSKSN